MGLTQQTLQKQSLKKMNMPVAEASLAPQDLLPSHSQNTAELYFPASLAARVAMWLSAGQWKVQTWCAPLSGQSTDISHGWDSFVVLSGLEDPKEDCEARPQGEGLILEWPGRGSPAKCGNRKRWNRTVSWAHKKMPIVLSCWDLRAACYSN